VRFWDLERLSIGHSGGLDDLKPTGPRKKRGAAARANRAHLAAQAKAGERDSPSQLRESTVSSLSNISSGPWSSRQTLTEATSVLSDDPNANSAEVLFQVPNRKRNPVHDPHHPLRFHEKVVLTELQYKRQSGFTARAADWSPCGRWCIVVGQSSIEDEGWGGFAVLHR
jgi:hypothetical protein